MTNPRQCKRFEACSAPLCPLDESSLATGLWYPDEEICKRRGFQQTRWLKNQKKIARVGSYDNGYFTKEMMDRRLTVKTGIRGIDPNRNGPRQIKKWLREHPDRKPSGKQLDHYKKRAVALAKPQKRAPSIDVSASNSKI